MVPKIFKIKNEHTTRVLFNEKQHRLNRYKESQNKMRKRIFVSIIIINALFLSCSPKVNEYYSGFVVDEFGKQIPDVLIEENTGPNPLKTHTNKSGFFKLNRIEGIICNLRLIKNGYKSDTISTYEIRYHSTGTDGDTEYLSLLTSDTTKIILQKQSHDFYDIKDLPVKWY